MQGTLANPFKPNATAMQDTLVQQRPVLHLMRKCHRGITVFYGTFADLQILPSAANVVVFTRKVTNVEQSNQSYTFSLLSLVAALDIGSLSLLLAVSSVVILLNSEAPVLFCKSLPHKALGVAELPSLGSLSALAPMPSLNGLHCRLHL